MEIEEAEKTEKSESPAKATNSMDKVEKVRFPSLSMFHLIRNPFRIQSKATRMRRRRRNRPSRRLRMLGFDLYKTFF